MDKEYVKCAQELMDSVKDIFSQHELKIEGKNSIDDISYVYSMYWELKDDTSKTSKFSKMIKIEFQLDTLQDYYSANHAKQKIAKQRLWQIIETYYKNFNPKPEPDKQNERWIIQTLDLN